MSSRSSVLTGDSLQAVPAQIEASAHCGSWVLFDLTRLTGDVSSICRRIGARFLECYAPQAEADKFQSLTQAAGRILFYNLHGVRRSALDMRRQLKCCPM